MHPTKPYLLPSEARERRSPHSGRACAFAAIQFVLDTMQGSLRAEERKSLLHEGIGSHVLSAYVEITLDNSDGRMPTDRSEVR
jgi:structural maintenance of chromosome 3 (chondroitin sulfate proteoglycan 6)